MSRTQSETKKPVFTLLPPHYHNEEVWRYLEKELKLHDYAICAPHLELNDPDITRDDHAEEMRKAEDRFGAERYIRCGASWGGDLIYRQIGSHVSKLVFMGAPLRPVLYRNGVPERRPEFSNDPTLPYAAYTAGEKEFNREELGSIFYQRLGNESIKAWAIGNLEPHPHVHEDPKKDENAKLPPDTDMHYIGFMNDEILRYTDQERTARYLGIDFIPFPTGHFAMLEKPKLTAELLVQIAEDRVDRTFWSDQARQHRLQALQQASPPIKIYEES